MTDNEIVKALECCTGDGLCCECPMWEKLNANCIVELNRLALEIIKGSRRSYTCNRQL